MAVRTSFRKIEDRKTENRKSKGADVCEHILVGCSTLLSSFVAGAVELEEWIQNECFFSIDREEGRRHYRAKLSSPLSTQTCLTSINHQLRTYTDRLSSDSRLKTVRRVIKRRL